MYVFLAICIENAVLRKILSKKQGKWARETKKQAAYNRLR